MWVRGKEITIKSFELMLISSFTHASILTISEEGKGGGTNIYQRLSIDFLDFFVVVATKGTKKQRIEGFRINSIPRSH